MHPLWFNSTPIARFPRGPSQIATESATLGHLGGVPRTFLAVAIRLTEALFSAQLEALDSSGLDLRFAICYSIRHIQRYINRIYRRFYHVIVNRISNMSNRQEDRTFGSGGERIPFECAQEGQCQVALRGRDSDLDGPGWNVAQASAWTGFAEVEPSRATCMEYSDPRPGKLPVRGDWIDGALVCPFAEGLTRVVQSILCQLTGHKQVKALRKKTTLCRSLSYTRLRRAIEELSDNEIERLMNFGRREADLIDEMTAAARAGDRNLVWQLARALCDLEDQLSDTPEWSVANP